MRPLAATAGWKRALVFGVLLLFLPSSPARAEDDAAFGKRLDAMRASAVKAARELADSLMPRPGVELEQAWRYPWSLPAIAESAIPSEEAYWQKRQADLCPAGIPEKDARRWVEGFVKKATEQGMPLRMTFLTFLHLTRGELMAPHEIMQGGLETCIRLVEEGVAARPHAGDEDPAVTERRLMKLINAPFEHMTDAEMKEATIRDLSFLDRITEMHFYKSNNWRKLAETRRESYPGAGVWLGMVKVRIMVVKPERARDIQELDAAALRQVQAKLSATFQKAKTGIWQMRERELREQIESAHRRNDRARVDELEQMMWREKTALQGSEIRIYPRDFGDSCYVLRIVGASASDLRLEVSSYSARMRLGHGIVHINLAGNFPEAEMTKAMDKFLTEVEARAMSFFE